MRDSHNYRIRMMTPDGAVKTFAGNGSEGNKDATNPLRASFAYPGGRARAGTQRAMSQRCSVLFVRGHERVLFRAGRYGSGRT